MRRAIERGDLEWEGRIVAAHHKLARVERVMVDDEARHAAEWERHNREFHIALISACGSSWLLNFHRAMYDQSLRYRMLSIRTKPFPRDQSAREHAEIVDLVLKHEADAATAEPALHITKRGVPGRRAGISGLAARRRRKLAAGAGPRSRRTLDLPLQVART